MDDPKQTAIRFFRVMGSGQAYLNLLYLLAAFPLGISYFVFLVSGLAIGISLSIIWVGIPILLLVGAGWWVLASFERFIAIHLLGEDIPEMSRPPNEDAGIWARLKEYLVNPVTWKSPLYLLLKFPLGTATFVILITLISLTLAFLTMPFTYEFLPEFQAGAFFGPGLPAWHIDSMSEALLGTLIGLLLWPVTLHITNGLAWVHAKFAKVMLSVDSMEWLTAIVEAKEVKEAECQCNLAEARAEAFSRRSNSERDSDQHIAFSHQPLVFGSRLTIFCYPSFPSIRSSKLDSPTFR